VAAYAGRFAELYDLFYADKPYAREAAFVAELLREHEGSQPVRRVLELACGTGTNAVQLAELGFSVIATDISADMLNRARGKSAAVDFRQQDMSRLDLPERPFDAAVCLFDSLGYLQTNEAILATLVRVREHLRPGAPFVVEVWHAAAMLRGFDPVRVRSWSSPLGEIVRISETKLRAERALAEVRYTIFDPQPGGTHQLVRETHVNRYFLCEEVRALAQQAGFESVELFAGFDRQRAIDGDTWHVVARLRSA
jgi:SAM-dependent methyltransferase